MRKKIIVILLIFIFIFNFKVDALGFDEIHKGLTEKALEINKVRVSKSSELKSWDLATYDEISDRVYWLLFYSKNRDIFGDKVDSSEYNWKRLAKDSFAIVWLESWFVNYYSQDNGAGFGFGGLHWNHIDTLNNYYNWEQINPYKVRNSNKLQARYIIGNLLMMKEYHKDRRKAIIAYNEGYIINDYQYSSYFLAVAGRINQIDKWLQ